MEQPSSQDSILEFDAAALAPVAMFMAKNGVRYYINGITVFPHPAAGGAIVAATDCRRLAMWWDEHGKCSRQFILKASPELITATRKRYAVADGISGRVVSLEQGRLVLKAHGAGVELFVQAGKAEIEARYPDVWRVVPDPEKVVPGLHGTMQASHLKDLGQAGAILGNQKAPREFGYLAHFSCGTDGSGSVLTRFGFAPQFVVITMPLRADEGFPHDGPLPKAFTGNHKPTA